MNTCMMFFWQARNILSKGDGVRRNETKQRKEGEREREEQKVEEEKEHYPQNRIGVEISNMTELCLYIETNKRYANDFIK